MLIPPKYFLTPQIAQLLQSIEASKEVINTVTIPPEKDQKLITFDKIRRRFMAVPPRTLSYDLKKLQDAGLIRKRGTTKGVYYEAIL